MFAYTDTKDSPWYVVEADDKRTARLNLISHLLEQIPYERVDHEQIELPPRAGARLRAPADRHPDLRARALPGRVAARRSALGVLALAVRAPRPAAGPALSFFQLLLGPANPALPGLVLLGILDPADELVAGQGRDVLPGIEGRAVGDQRLAKVRGQLVHDAGGDSLATHRAMVCLDKVGGLERMNPGEVGRRPEETGRTGRLMGRVTKCVVVAACLVAAALPADAGAQSTGPEVQGEFIATLALASVGQYPYCLGGGDIYGPTPGWSDPESDGSYFEPAGTKPAPTCRQSTVSTAPD